MSLFFSAPMRLVLSLTLSCLLVACQSGSTGRPMPRERAAPEAALPSTENVDQGASAPAAATIAAATPDAPKLNKRTFGAPLGVAPKEDLDSVLARPSAHAGKTMKVEGHVRRACTKKGCWMELAVSDDPSAPSCRVTFKDYGFFVPTNSAGSRATLEGVMNVRRVEPKLVSHLEAEGAQFAGKSADGSAEEVRFVATGVELFEKGS
jgi:hypothetical protein